MFPLSAIDLADSGDCIRGFAQAKTDLVPRNVVRNQAEICCDAPRSPSSVSTESLMAQNTPRCDSAEAPRLLPRRFYLPLQPEAVTGPRLPVSAGRDGRSSAVQEPRGRRESPQPQAAAATRARWIAFDDS